MVDILFLFVLLPFVAVVVGIVRVNAETRQQASFTCEKPVHFSTSNSQSTYFACASKLVSIGQASQIFKIATNRLQVETNLMPWFCNLVSPLVEKLQNITLKAYLLLYKFKKIHTYLFHKSSAFILAAIKTSYLRITNTRFCTSYLLRLFLIK